MIPPADMTGARDDLELTVDDVGDEELVRAELVLVLGVVPDVGAAVLRRGLVLGLCPPTDTPSAASWSHSRIMRRQRKILECSDGHAQRVPAVSRDQTPLASPCVRPSDRSRPSDHRPSRSGDRDRHRVGRRCRAPPPGTAFAGSHVGARRVSVGDVLDQRLRIARARRVGRVAGRPISRRPIRAPVRRDRLPRRVYAFSTFSVEADLLVKDGHALTAGLYVVASLVVGVAAAWVGVVGARALASAIRAPTLAGAVSRRRPLARRHATSSTRSCNPGTTRSSRGARHS